MKQRLVSTINSIIQHFGYRLERIERSHLRSPIPAGARLYVGCGDQQIEGYFGCDLRPLPNVCLACKAWEVSRFCGQLNEIYSRHMLEHLTFAEMQLTLTDWLAALAPGGVVRIEIPNLEFAIQQWQRAVWNREAMDNKFSDARWGFAGFFGWQRECDPMKDDYTQSYWDVHKSGYTEKSIRFFLEQAGYHQIDIGFESFTPEQIRRRKLGSSASENCHLIAIARKPATAMRAAA